MNKTTGGYQICKDSKKLPEWHWKCDGNVDCQDESDEEDCKGKPVFEYQHKQSIIKKIIN